MPPAGGHAVLQSDQKIFIQFLLLAAGLVLEALALFNGVVLLGIRGRDLLSIDATFEDFDGRRILRREFRQRPSRALLTTGCPQSAQRFFRQIR